MSSVHYLLRLADTAAAASGQASTVLLRRATGRGDMHARLRRGCDITTRRAARIAQWLSDHWPAGAEWPADVPRPAPSAPAGGGAAESQPAAPAAPADILAEVRAARERALEAAARHDWAVVEREMGAAERTALTLRADGRIACPAAVCEMFGAPRHVYDDAVRRYAGRPDRRPRPGTPTNRVVLALRASGDRRFLAGHEEAA